MEPWTSMLSTVRDRKSTCADRGDEGEPEVERRLHRGGVHRNHAVPVERRLQSGRSPPGVHGGLGEAPVTIPARALGVCRSPAQINRPKVGQLGVHQSPFRPALDVPSPDRRSNARSAYRPSASTKCRNTWR